MTRVSVHFTHAATTKSCEKYEAKLDEAQAARLRSQSVYLEKSAFGSGPAPKEITLTLEWA